MNKLIFSIFSIINYSRISDRFDFNCTIIQSKWIPPILKYQLEVEKPGYLSTPHERLWEGE
jgi:hypothetical protein